MPICRKCSNKFPNRIKIDGRTKNLSKRRFCLDCSPFNKHNTSQNPSKEGCKFCPRCKNQFALNCFYTRKNQNPMSWCINCVKEQCAQTQRLFKIQCVHYKGGKCEKCDYSKCIGAFDFHHLDPSKKLFGINTSWKKGFTDEVKKELDKCMLLCATCHREIHYPYQDSNLELQFRKLG